MNALRILNKKDILKIKKTHTILFVQNQEDSIRFYEKLLRRKPILNVPGMTEFELQENHILGLMPSENIERIIDEKMKSIQKNSDLIICELYIYVDNLDEMLDYCKAENFNVVSDLKPRNWGDRAFYISDQDGHLIAFSEPLKNKP